MEAKQKLEAAYLELKCFSDNTFDVLQSNNISITAIGSDNILHSEVISRVVNLAAELGLYYYMQVSKRCNAQIIIHA